MRLALLTILAVIQALAQDPVVVLRNTSRPGASDFQIGDGFEIVVSGSPNQPVSVRTNTQARFDWSPIIGTTDSVGRWSTHGQFEKNDFGGWHEFWTVGGKLANPEIQFFVNAPCLVGGATQTFTSGPNTVVRCETSQGPQTYSTPSLSDSFRSPDGRLIPGRQGELTTRQHQAEIVHYLISAGAPVNVDGISLQSSHGGALGDETAELVTDLIGVNALTPEETRHVVALMRSAFEKPESIQPTATIPTRTLELLRKLADSTDQTALKREIAEMAAYVQAR